MPISPKRHRNLARRIRMERLETRRLLAAGSDDLASLIDEFDDPSTLGQWSRVNETEGWNADQLQVWDIDQSQPGRMVMQPETVSWYENYRGPMAFKEVTGDFVFTTQVHITDRDEVGDSDPDLVPDDAQFSLGGLMIRTPREITDPAVDWAAGGENYVFLSMGHGTNGQFTYEVKTTETSNSNLILTPTDSNTATLQIARIGDAIIALRQEPGEDWIVHQRYVRPDMPETMQLGLVSYSDWGKAGDFSPFFHNSNVLQPGTTPDPTPEVPFNPDLVVGYEFARYARPEVPVVLQGVDLVNNATDQQLIDFLGDNANSPADNTEALAEFSVTITDAMGVPVDTVHVGDEFFAEILVDDLRPLGTGVFSAFTDVLYDNGLASTTGPINFGATFPSAHNADTSTPGVVDELGGVGNDFATDGSPQLLARISLTANAPGELHVTTDAADHLPAHEMGLHGLDEPVESNRQVFGTDSVTIEVANQPPVTGNDSENLFHDSGSISIDVLANDSTEAGETLTIVSIATANAAGGEFEIVDGHVQFTPADGHYGNSVTEYTIDDGNGAQATGTVTVSVAHRWHLSAFPQDTNDDGDLSPLDALRVINAISRNGVFDTPAAPAGTLAEIEYYLDVNNDGHVSLLDALNVINALGDQSPSDSIGSDESGGGHEGAQDQAILSFLEEEEDDHLSQDTNLYGSILS